MPDIALITDSASDLDARLAADAGIEIVPIDVRLGDLGPDQVRSLTPADFWQRCASGSAVPETSAPSPGSFHAAFLRARDRGCTGVVCVTISSSLSATYQAACNGAQEAAGEIEVAVIDSRSASLGLGMAALDGARRAAGGGGLEEVCGAVRDHLVRTSIFGVLDTLEYLRRGGRIGAAQAVFGSLLSIKPVIQLRDGEVVAESKQRTRSRSIRYLVERVAKLGPLERLGVVHAAATDDDLALLLDLVGSLEVAQAPIVGDFGPVIGAHTGPGTLALCAVQPPA